MRRAPGVVDIGSLQQRPDAGFEPVAIHPHVVVRERDDGSRGGRHSGVERVRLALPRLEQVTEGHRIAGSPALDDGARVVGGVVVHDDDFPAEIGADLHGCQAVERLRQQAGAIERADQD